MTAGIIEITNIITCLLILAISSYIALFGIKKLSKFNLYLVAIIIVLIITTALPYLSFKAFISTTQCWYNLPHLPIRALIYAGLNCFMFPELISTLSQNYKKRTLLSAGIMTAILVTTLVGLILSIIQATNTKSNAMPLLAAVPNKVTITIVLLAIFTSQYTALFALIQRLNKIMPKTKNKPLSTVTCLCLCALTGSLLGFTHIIKIGYPLIGIFTCFYLLFSFLAKFWKPGRHHQS